MKQLLLALAALIAGFSIHSQAAHGSQPRTVVETVYSAFAQGDMEALAGLMSPDIVWNEAEGNPYADMNPYIGPEAVMSGLMARFVTEWEDISVTPHEYVVEGDRVVVFGRYKETWKATGQAIDIPFVHSWTVEDGRLIEFQQFTDTAALVETMGERPGTAATEEQTQAYEQSAVFPADRSLVRPDHGVMLADDTLLIADQVNGLMALDPEGAKRPFGDFASAGYVHEPPERSAGPNGVAIEPDGIHVLVADILTGAIYRINTETEQVVRIHQHEFGANSARRDSSGAVWFSQSIRIRSYRFEPADGTLSEGRILAELPTPDNIELDSARRLCGAALVVDGGQSKTIR